jgi:peptidoglycan/LPS O-acetylase OafA/YrhL
MVMAFYAFALRPRLPATAGNRIGAALRFLGNHSLEIFLIHQPLMREYNYYLHGRWFNVGQPSPFSLIVGMAIALAVTVLLSVELRRLLQKLPFPAKA